MSHFRSLDVTRRSPVIAKDYSHSNRINSISFAPLYLNFILSKKLQKDVIETVQSVFYTDCQLDTHRPSMFPRLNVDQQNPG